MTQNIQVSIDNDTIIETQYGTPSEPVTKLRSINTSIDNDTIIETQSGDRLLAGEEIIHIIKDNDIIKTFDLINQEWIDLTDSSQRTIEKNGMTDLGNLIQNTTKTVKTNKKVDLTNGQQFSQPVNFKAFKAITNISVI